MINILIVDDEADIRIALIKMLDTHYPNKFVIHQADNGEKALEIAFSMKIDLIITDIKMPVCTGLEMMERLKLQKYMSYIIVVSGFDDYELVRQAMKLGAYDYLLKPLEEEELYKLVDNIIVGYESEKSLSKQDNINKNNLETSVYRNQYILTNLLDDFDTEKTTNLLKQHNLQTYSKSTIAVIDISQNPINKNILKKVWFYEIVEAMNKNFPTHNQFIQGEYKQLWVILFFHNNELENTIFTRIIKDICKNKAKFNISKSVSHDLLQSSISNCIRNLEMFFYDISSSKQPPTEEYPYANLLDTILKDVISLNFKDFCINIHHWLSFVSIEKPPMNNVKDTLISLVYQIMQKNNKFIRVLSNYKFTENDIIETIKNSFSIYALKKDIIRIIDIYINDVISSQVESDDFYVQKAKKYIYKNFQNNLTLTEVSEHLSIHPNYFSSLFKQKTDISFSGYLRKIRIEEACRIIKETNKKFYEIAEAVGYNDAIQFNRAFKQEMGVPPSVYKNKVDIN